jgi:adenine-specific DNA-methyltransferase
MLKWKREKIYKQTLLDMNDKNWENLEPTFSLVEDRLRILKQALPEAFTDGKINFDTLKELLGEAVADEEQDEHFGLSWTGKREARKLAGMPSKGTLVPVKGKGLHEDTTENIFIEGDNLEVLKLLHKSYYGKIKMIYIDPPYNTGNDFIYKDDYKMPLESYLQRSGQMDEMDEMLTSNPKSSGRFHSDWLNMIYPRLRVAMDLMRDDGVIFVSIDDNEVYNLRQMMNEVFGEENFIAEMIWEGANKNDARQIGVCHEYVLVFAKSRDAVPRSWVIAKEGVEPILRETKRLQKEHGEDFESASNDLAAWFRVNKATPSFMNRRFRYIDKNGVYKEDDPTAPGGRKFDLRNPKTGGIIPLRANRGWGFDQDTFEKMVDEGRITFITDTSIMVRRYLHETDRLTPQSVFYQPARSASERLVRLMNAEFFDFPKDEKILQQFADMATEVSDKSCIILDFFAGSGTTGQAVFEQNLKDGGRRKFICVQIDEKTPEDSQAFKTGFRCISEITAERIRRASKKIEKELDGGLPLEQKPDLGFKFYRLERSNFKAWSDYQGTNLDELRGLLQAQVSTSFVPDATKEGILTEILLIEGFPLDSDVSQDETFERNTVWRVSSEFSEHRLFVTLDEEIWEETISTAEELESNDIFICLDKALSDESKIRMSDVCRLKVI